MLGVFALAAVPAAAGGVLGKVIATTDLVNFITAHAATLESLGLPLIDEALTDTMDHLPYFQETD